MSAQSHCSSTTRPWAVRGPDRSARVSETSTGRLSLRVREERASTVIAAGGELDLATGEELDCVPWDVQRRGRSVVIDLRALEFIDCAGIRSLLGGQLPASSWLGHLEIVCAGGQVRRLLALTEVDQLIQVVDPTASLAFVPTLAARADRNPEERDHAVA